MRIFSCPSGASLVRTARTSPAKTAGRASTAWMVLSVSVMQALGGKGNGFFHFRISTSL